MAYDLITASKNFGLYIIVAGSIHGWSRLDALWWTPI